MLKLHALTNLRKKLSSEFHQEQKQYPSLSTDYYDPQQLLVVSLQCFDIVRWATGRASDLKKVGCWFVGGDDFTGVLHVL